MKSARKQAIELTFEKHSTPRTRELLRGAFEVKPVTLQSAANDFVVVEDTDPPINKDVIVTGFIDL